MSVTIKTEELKIHNFKQCLDTFINTIDAGQPCRKFPLTWEQWEYLKLQISNFSNDDSYIQLYRLREDKADI